MNVNVKLHIKSNRFPELIAKLPGAVSEEIRRAAFDVETTAKGFCPVDTGFLQNSIQADIEPFGALIQPNAEYEVFVERGTRKMAAQPYMAPAAEICGPRYIENMEKLFRSL